MQQGLSRSKTDKIVGGVCAGIARYINVDPLLVRLLFAVMVLVTGDGLLVYGILWMVLPEADETDVKAKNSDIQLYRSSTDRQVAGVAAGLAQYFGIDPIVIRLAFVLMAMSGGSGILLYVMLAIIIPEEPVKRYDQPVAE